jgi:hypothetical protein
VELSNQKLSKGIDLCFLMDCTDSMHKWIQQAKEKLLAVQEEARKMNPGCDLRVAFVGYRDIHDAKRFEVFDFHQACDFCELKEKIGQIRAGGGGDRPEDVAGGLAKARELSWKHRTRLMVHVADAPCHGTKYHKADIDDDYPDGDPGGLAPEEVLKKLMAQQHVNYFFLKINSSTDQMTGLFKKAVAGVTKLCEVHDMTGSDASVFVRVVVDSLEQSLTEEPGVRSRSSSKSGSTSRSRSSSKSNSSSRSSGSGSASSFVIGSGGGAGFADTDSDSDDGPGI